jgi:hypothetical protein
MQAWYAYAACMQYTLRNVPPHVNEALRARARKDGKSLNEVALETLLIGLGLAGKPVKHRDLSDVAGTWVGDPEIDQALEDQRRVDPELWR